MHTGLMNIVNGVCTGLMNNVRGMHVMPSSNLGCKTEVLRKHPIQHFVAYSLAPSRKFTKVEHQAGSTVEVNPHVLPFALSCFHGPALQGCLELGRLNPLNHLCRSKDTDGQLHHRPFFSQICQAYCHHQLLELSEYVCQYSDAQPVFCRPPPLVALALLYVKARGCYGLPSKEVLWCRSQDAGCPLCRRGML